MFDFISLIEMARDSALTRDRSLVVVSENTSATTANSQTGQPNTEDINQQILEVSLQFYNYKTYFNFTYKNFTS